MVDLHDDRWLADPEGNLLPEVGRALLNSTGRRADATDQVGNPLSRPTMAGTDLDITRFVSVSFVVAAIGVALIFFSAFMAWSHGRTVTTIGQNGIVLRDSVDVRQGPGRAFNAIDLLSRGETVRVAEVHKNGWCRITRKGRPSGWLYSGWISNVHVFGRSTCVFLRPVGGFRVGEPFLVERRKTRTTVILILPRGDRVEVPTDAVIEVD